MQLECLIKRVGITTVTLEKVKYSFFPIPGTKSGEVSTSVCEVDNAAHAAYLLKTKQYREYNQEQAIAEAKIKEKTPYEGYAIEKYMDSGYVAVNKKTTPFEFAGADSIWKKEKVNITPWKTEVEAFNFIKEEAAAQEPAEDNIVNDVTKLAGVKKGKK